MGATDDDEADERRGWPRGLVGIGGALEPDTLLEAYRAGIFPWSSVPEITWWSPDPRVVFDLDRWRPHRSVARSVRRAGWTFSCDRDFTGVMRGCAEPTPKRSETWIGEDFIRAYSELHRRGYAHSVEVWEGEHLVGGIYGVAIGGFFGGESMFHRRTDASKAALAYLVTRLKALGYQLLDAQARNPHLMRLGATAIPRQEYLRRLRRAIRHPTGDWPRS
jgi:leucyl/phenylalanyl-tRNA--protein transferase